MRLRAHNSVKIEYDGVLAASPNSVMDFKGCLNPEKPYAAYIISGAACEEAKLENINSDVQKGGLFAEYSAVFEKSEYDGLEFSSFSLSPDGVKELNRAAFKPIIKETGKAVRVFVTVYLEAGTGDLNILMGGANPLAEFFLGKAGFAGSAGAVSGACNMKSRGVDMDIDAAKISPASFSFANGAVMFSAVTPVSKPEVIFTLDTKPVIRVYAYEKRVKLRSGSATVKTDFTFALDASDVEEMISISQNGTAITGGHLYHGFNSIVKTRGIAGFKMPLFTRIKSDVFERYAAVANEKEVFFFAAEDGAPKLLYRKPLKETDDFDVCEDGYLVLFGSENLKVISKTGQERIYPVARDVFNAAFNEGAFFSYFSYNPVSRLIRTFKLYPDGTYAQIIKYTAAVPVESFKSFFGVYFLCGQQPCSLITSANTIFSSQVQLLLLCSGATRVVAVSGLACVLKQDIYTFATEDNDRYTLAAGAEVKALDKFFAVKENNEVYLLLFDRAKRAFIKIMLPEFKSINDIKSAAAIGDYLLICDSSDNVSTYYRNRSSAFLWYPGLTKSQTLTYTAAVRGAYNYTLPSLKVTVTAAALN